MPNEKMWILTVVAALSSLIILAYFLLAPMLSKESTAQKIDTNLETSVKKFDSIKAELRGENKSAPGT